MPNSLRSKVLFSCCLGILAFSLVGYCLWWHPVTLRLFYDRAFLQFALRDPELLSSLRPLDWLGLAYYRKSLKDVSLAADEKNLTFYRRTLTELETYEAPEIKGPEALSYILFKDFLKNAIDTTEQWTWYDYPVTQLSGIHIDYPQFMSEVHLIHNVAEAHDYIVRLQALPLKMQQTLEQMAAREARGFLPPRFAVEGAIQQIQSFLAVPPIKNSLYTSLHMKLEQSRMGTAQKAHIEQEAKEALEQDVYPAYQKLKLHLEQILPQTSSDAGLWRFSEGDKAYRHALWQHTTLELDPDQIHQIGLADVARLEKDIRSIFEQEYGTSEGTIDQLFQKLNADERYFYPDTEEGRQAILNDYSAILQEIEAQFDLFVPQLPRAKVVVQRIPSFAEKSAPAGYYSSPSLDGAIPGKFHVNLYDIKATPKYGMRTLSYHEMFPGHHLQAASSLEIKGQPFFRKILPFTAFDEGWALYAEQVAWELGFIKHPADKLGRLQSELFRAVRLVVDTGLHAKRWSRDQAISYMKEHTGMSLSEVTAEIERYSVTPGQACAYKIGMMKILELRDKARSELGEHFQLTEFHREILAEGALPLPLLEEKIQTWILEKKAHS